MLLKKQKNPRGRGRSTRGGRGRNVSSRGSFSSQNRISKTPSNIHLRKQGPPKENKKVRFATNTKPAKPIFLKDQRPNQPNKGTKKVLRKLSDTNYKNGSFPEWKSDPTYQVQELKDFEIKSIFLDIYSFEEMQRLSSVDITTTSKDNKPIRGSVNDPRLGSYEPLSVCENCNEKDCPGHYGLIKFPKEFPIVNPLYLNRVTRVLNCVCNDCGSLLLSKKTLESKGILKLTGEKRFRAITELCVNVTCAKRKKILQEEGETNEEEIVSSTCQNLEQGIIQACTPNVKYFPAHSYAAGVMMYKTSKTSPADVKSTKEVFDILNCISDEDARLLDFNPPRSHPRDMILRGILVLPISARPPYIQGSTVQVDKLVKYYDKIVSAKNKLERAIVNERQDGNVEESYKHMVMAVRELIDGKTIKTYPHEKPTPIIDRIQHKEGLFRKPVMGKRVNFCARTVLGPDPNLRFGQVRVPEKMSDRLVQFVDVFRQNKKAVEKMLEDGEILNIQTNDGQMMRVLPNRKYPIKVGMRVERKLQNGDAMIFNRQPTLHAPSIQAYETVLGKQNTIGLALTSTTPHNADFDGDEGNLLPMMDYLTIAEAKYVMNAKNCLISAQTNAPLVGMIMNTLSGLFILTSDNPRDAETDPKNRKEPEPDPNFPREEFESFLGSLTYRNDLVSLPYRAIRQGIHPYSGKALVSALFPPDFYYKRGDVEIVDGILIRGRITSKHMGTSHRSIMQEMRKDPRFGNERAISLLTDAPYLVQAFLDAYGFTVGISDCAPKGDKIRRIIDRKIAAARIEYEQLLSQPVKSKIEKEYKENQLVATLSKLSGAGKEIAEKEFTDKNAIRIMSKGIGSGAKGSAANINQLTAMLGQQFVFGKRPPALVSGGSRVMCTYEPYDEGMEARGCVLNSFSSGLNPSEYFIHAMSSRQGLMDTAIKTSETGSIHHKMVKVIGVLITAYDGTVRDHLNHIVQFTYGNDGLNASELVSAPTKTSQNIATFIDLEMTTSQLNVERGWIPKQTSKSILKSRKEMLRSLRKSQ